jgi:hypothetical protein
MSVKMIASVIGECEVRTVGDLRGFVEWCDTHSISDEKDLDWGSGKLYVELAGGDSEVDWIECGDHPPGIGHDLLVAAHHHE